MSYQSRTKNGLYGIMVIAVIGLVFIIMAWKAPESKKTSSLTGLSAVVYRSPTCGCCANYISYLRRQGVKVEEKVTADMTTIKKQLNIPEPLVSCHTTEIDGYVVEGHVPVEAIEKLIVEKPKVAGIGMGGMPSGSPGMPGAKTEPFEIESFTADGSTTLFVSI